jgi:hypothetical protein
MVSKERTKPMAQQRKRIGPLDTAGSVAVENVRVYKELRRGRIEPSSLTLKPDDGGEVQRRSQNFETKMCVGGCHLSSIDEHEPGFGSTKGNRRLLF